MSNAGIFNSIPFDELSPDDWRRMLTVHLDGGFYLSQPAYRLMKAQKYGGFVFVSSSGGMFGQPLEAHYAAAKAGLVGLSNVIAIEGAEHGILSNTVLPFGFSRMVTETVGDQKALDGLGQGWFAEKDSEPTADDVLACAGRFARVFVVIWPKFRRPSRSPCRDRSSRKYSVLPHNSASPPDRGAHDAGPAAHLR